MAQDPFHLRRHARLDAALVEREIRRFLAEQLLRRLGVAEDSPERLVQLMGQ